MGSEQNRFPHHEHQQQLQQQQRGRKRWGACFTALSCFGAQQKGGKRIVPASRIPEGNHPSASQPQPPGSQPAPSLLAPPSSPASFSQSAIPSTAQSPSCFLSLSANSPGGPSSTMFATGPYAHETQLVSPPVFSTFTTEPSTAPLTPPPELAFLTTPSSPDVPFAQFLTSSMNLKTTSEKNGYLAANDLQVTYSLYPGSPASSLRRSPNSRLSGDCLSSSFPEREFPSQWDPSDSSQNGKYSRNGPGTHFGHDTTAAPKASQDANFFCPATFAQFYLDQNPPFPNTGGRLSISKESETSHAGANGHQNRYNKSPKQDVEELEAYRASFGFSADEIVTTPQYVEISDVMDDSFTMTPFPSNKASYGGTAAAVSEKVHTAWTYPPNQNGTGASHVDSDACCKSAVSTNEYEDYKSRMKPIDVSRSSALGNRVLSDDEDDIFARAASSKIIRKYQLGLSSSDAEIDYRRGRSLREGRRDLAWRG